MAEKEYIEREILKEAIELAENAIEIWATLNGEIGCFMFFDYTKGVIKCK